MYLLNAKYFLDQHHETMNRAEFISPEYFSDGFDHLIAVTHRWATPLSPNDGDLNFLELRNRIGALIESRRLTRHDVDRVAVFYDYSSIYQAKTVDDLVLYGVYLQMHGTSEEYDSQAFLDFATASRRRDLESLFSVFLVADDVYMSKYHQKDYYARCWCLMEALAGRLRGTLIDRTGPFHTEENLRWHRAYQDHAKRLHDNPDDSDAVELFRELVESASCTVAKDRELTASYVPRIVDRVRQYMIDESHRTRDRELLRLRVSEERQKAIRWARRA